MNKKFLSIFALVALLVAAMAGSAFAAALQGDITGVWTKDGTNHGNIEAPDRVDGDPYAGPLALKAHHIDTAKSPDITFTLVLSMDQALSVDGVLSWDSIANFKKLNVSPSTLKAGKNTAEVTFTLSGITDYSGANTLDIVKLVYADKDKKALAAAVKGFDINVTPSDTLFKSFKLTDTPAINLGNAGQDEDRKIFPSGLKLDTQVFSAIVEMKDANGNFKVQTDPTRIPFTVTNKKDVVTIKATDLIATEANDTEYQVYLVAGTDIVSPDKFAKSGDAVIAGSAGAKFSTPFTVKKVAAFPMMTLTHLSGLEGPDDKGAYYAIAGSTITAELKAELAGESGWTFDSFDGDPIASNQDFTVTKDNKTGTIKVVGTPKFAAEGVTIKAEAVFISSDKTTKRYSSDNDRVETFKFDVKDPELRFTPAEAELPKATVKKPYIIDPITLSIWGLATAPDIKTSSVKVTSPIKGLDAKVDQLHRLYITGTPEATGEFEVEVSVTYGTAGTPATAKIKVTVGDEVHPLTFDISDAEVVADENGAFTAEVGKKLENALLTANLPLGLEATIATLDFQLTPELAALAGLTSSAATSQPNAVFLNSDGLKESEISVNVVATLKDAKGLPMTQTAAGVFVLKVGTGEPADYTLSLTLETAKAHRG